QLRATQARKAERTELDQQLGVVAADEPPIDFAAEVEQAGELAERGAHRGDVLRGFWPESSNGSQRDADGADRPAVFEDRGFHHESIAALIDTGWQQQHAE